MRRFFPLPLLLATISMSLSACGDFAWAKPLELQVDCSQPNCGWSAQQGQVERTGSWHPKDFAFSLVGAPARITRTIPVTSNPACLHFSYIGDVDADAQARLLLDFDDDGTDDAETVLPVSHWTRQTVQLRAPADYTSLRVSLQKDGEGTTKLALFSMKGDSSCGAEPATKLQNGAVCTLDATCRSERCLLGHCSACGAGGCAEGEACRDSGECLDGACAAQVCRKCAKEGSCGSADGCSVPGQCRRQNCVAGSAPSMSKLPTMDSICGECAEASDCGGQPCVLGRCAGCAVDSECASGLVCRWLDPFDALQRGCAPRTTSLLPRGALCENDSECEGSLPCGAGEGRAKRCGKACGKAGDCSAEHVCLAPGARKVSNLPERFAITSRWSELAGRIATCWPRATYHTRCELHEQCSDGTAALSGMSCCDGRCDHGKADLATGICPDSHESL